jgi:hypothetical protein
MESIELWARHGEAVRQAIELGQLVHMETTSEEFADEFLLFASESGLEDVSELWICYSLTEEETHQSG